MDWKTGLDRWLTTPPEDPYENYEILVWERIPESLVSDYEYDLVDDHLLPYEDFLFRQYEAGYFRSLDEVADVLGRFVRRMIDQGRWRRL